MIDYARAVDPLEEALIQLDAMLGGLADDHGAYRSTEELLGGIAAVRDRLFDACQYATARARGCEEPSLAAHAALCRARRDVAAAPQAEGDTVAAAL